MKKLLLISFLIPSISFASVKGIGEYFYGPDTSQNMACSFAEERAKENAIENFSGLFVESKTVEICSTDECSFFRETNNNVTGTIKNVINKKIHNSIEEGQKICIVEIEAVVEKKQNNVILHVKDFSAIIKENTEVNFSIIVNKPGKFILFNHYDQKYHKIYESKNDLINESFNIPKKNKMFAKLTNKQITSKEKLVFVYLTVDIPVKMLYNDFEMKIFLRSLPSNESFVVQRFIQIVR